MIILIKYWNYYDFFISKLINIMFNVKFEFGNLSSVVFITNSIYRGAKNAILLYLISAHRGV